MGFGNNSSDIVMPLFGGGTGEMNPFPAPFLDFNRRKILSKIQTESRIYAIMLSEEV
jgi:hypothetical protein